MLQFSRYIQTVDSHTMGEPTRIVTGGAPRILGKSMMEKKNHMETRLDWLRKLLMNEPRGHKDMFGAVITDPCIEDCDLGVIFMDSKGYLNMCGHGTIGTVTTAINLGIVEPKPIIRLDTPAGVIECRVEMDSHCVKQVTFTNVPSFVFKQNAEIEVEGIGTVTLDIAFGGSIFGIVDARPFHLRLVPQEQQKLVSLGMSIKKAANEQLYYEHPLIPEIHKIDLIEFSIPSATPGVHYRNAVVFGNGQVDRSPCGTGTCAKMALLHQQGKLSIGENFVHESIIDSSFIGRCLSVTSVGEYPGVIPEISGSAWVTGMHQFIIEKDDPFQDGFLVG
ncbi:proline racemase family protein [Paenibacillus alkalitolerans]|uniref:proline racemase family protein n=1 Tax=Paenibacillus alkalitolerans TaxID=2799335 RepID=UPI0018F4A1E6|nr:proline racemase family protein [Paenibacillus alkalitolerans]